jgi:hypothetical protein
LGANFDFLKQRGRKKPKNDPIAECLTGKKGWQGLCIDINENMTADFYATSEVGYAK